MQLHLNTQYLFKAKSVAIIDSDETADTLGQIVLGNLLKAKFSGEIFFVHKHLKSVNGLDCFRNITDIPKDKQPIELGVICTSKNLFLEHLHELGQCGARAVVIIGLGLKEPTMQEVELHSAIKEVAEQYNMAVLGPKSLGTICMYNNLDTSVSPGNSLPGSIGFFSQSEALCITMFNWLEQSGIGYSSFTSLGTKAAIDEADIIAYLAKDKNTKVIAGHLESIDLDKRFLQNAQLACLEKPVIILKSGRTPMGARAASAHTGSHNHEDFVYDAVFKQTGIIRAETTEDLFVLANAFASQPLPKGNGVAIISNDGGTGVLAADECEKLGLNIAELSNDSLEDLRHTLSAQATLFNPINVLSCATAEQISSTVEIALQDPAVFSVIVLLTSGRQTPLGEIATQIADICQKFDKPLVSSLFGSRTVQAGKDVFIKKGIPCYPFPEKTVSVLATMYKQSLWKENYTPVEINYRTDATKAKKAIESARLNGKLDLSKDQAQSLLQAYEIPVLESRLASTSEQAVQMAKQLGLPVALKISSPSIERKGEINGVALNLGSKEKVRSSFTELTNMFMRNHPEKHLSGCLVQSMAPANSREVSMGFKRVKAVGALVRFSLGGLHAEVFKDVAWRTAPLSLDDVYAMIREIKAFPILAGGHGQKAVNFNVLEDMLLILSQMAKDFPEVQEVDLNPVMVNETSAFVVDMRISLDEPKSDE